MFFVINSVDLEKVRTCQERNPAQVFIEIAPQHMRKNNIDYVAVNFFGQRGVVKTVFISHSIYHYISFSLIDTPDCDENVAYHA